jgi:hypothetical protein
MITAPMAISQNIRAKIILDRPVLLVVQDDVGYHQTVMRRPGTANVHATLDCWLGIGTTWESWG